jgi:hypothetical protein
MRIQGATAASMAAEIYQRIKSKLKHVLLGKRSIKDKGPTGSLWLTM